MRRLDSVRSMGVELASAITGARFVALDGLA
jgi:hypothetical protein